MSLLHGVAFGALFVFTIGPTFFAILQSSLSRGFTAGVMTALGISICDISYATLASLGLSNLIENESFRWWLALIGGTLLFVFGIVSMVKKPQLSTISDEGEKGGLSKFFIKGVLINGINPFVVIFWMGIVGMSTVNWGYTGWDQHLFIIGMLGMILSTDILKSFLANRLRTWITMKRITIINRVVGAALVLFSLQLFYETIK
ncbi:MAG: LysE family transporter [Cyclobacteriaceae bacterium]